VVLNLSPYRQEKGLVAHYTFDHADARDSTDYGNTGTLQGDASASGGVLTLGVAECGAGMGPAVRDAFSAWLLAMLGNQTAHMLVKRRGS